MSLFGKIKKGLGLDILNSLEEEREKTKKERNDETIERITFEVKEKKVEIEDKEEKKEEKTKPKAVVKKIPKESLIKNLTNSKMTEVNKKNTLQSEGQLAIDLAQTNEEFIIQATLAGVKPEDLDILIEDDLVVIKGIREHPPKDKNTEYDYIIQECYWGPFSREVILPEEIKVDDVQAVLKGGILTIKLPKLKREKKRKVVVKVKD